MILPTVLSVAALSAPPRAEEAATDEIGRAYYYFSLAQQDRLARRYREAVTHLGSAVSFDPGSGALRLELARLYWMLRNTTNDFEANALEQGEQAVLLEPDALEVHRFLALVYSERAGQDRGSLDKAILHHERALALTEEGDRKAGRLDLGKLYQQAGRPVDAVRVLEDLVHDDPRSVQGLYWLAMAYAGDRRLGEAVAPLEAAIELSPESIHLSEALAELHERRGDLRAAIEATRFLISNAPDSLLHYIRLARLYRGIGDLTAALEVYDRAETVARSGADPDYRSAVAELRLARTEVLLEAGQPKEALRVVNEALEDDPESVRLGLALGQLKYRTGDRDGGIATLNALLDARPGDARVKGAVSDAFLTLGAMQEQDGDQADSERLLERSIEVNPENDTALNFLGYMWADRDVNLDQSIRYIERALRIRGEVGAYLDSLGWAYYRQGRYDKAEGYLARAAQMEPEESEIHDHLGDLYHAMGKVPEAIQAWEKAVAVGAEDVDAIRAKIRSARRGGGRPR